MRKILRGFRIRLGRYEVTWSVRKVGAQGTTLPTKSLQGGVYKLHIGPGPGWKKPTGEWVTLDVDPTRGDVVIDLNNFERLPFEDDSVACCYGSHIFEHVSIFSSQRLFKECYRVLVPGRYFRLVLPDVRRSIEEYLRGNTKYRLFQRRKEHGIHPEGLEDYTIFECLREDFISPSGQPGLLGDRALAHQNAWDFETIVADLRRAGFRAEEILKMESQETMCPDFAFEGTYPSEANESYRSLYVEARKTK